MHSRRRFTEQQLKLIGELIKKECSLRGMFQKDLAVKSGLSTCDISNIITRSRVPSFEKVERIANAFGYELNEFLSKAYNTDTRSSAIQTAHFDELHAASSFISALSEAELLFVFYLSAPLVSLFRIYKSNGLTIDDLRHMFRR